MARRFPRIVFVLGAGASRPAGIPTMEEFTKEFRAYLNTSSESSKLLIRKLDKIKDFLTNSTNCASAYDLESLFELLLFINRPMQDVMPLPFSLPKSLGQDRESQLLEYLLKRYIQNRCLSVKEKRLNYLRPLIKFTQVSPTINVASLK